MDINDFYQEITDSIFKGRPFKQFHFYYQMLTDDKEDKYFMPWIDYVLDRYNIYESQGFTPLESKINSMSDGLEGLLNG